MFWKSLLALLLALPCAALADVTLTFSHREGEQKQREQFKLNQRLNIAGMDIDTDVENSMSMKITSEKPDADGNFPMVTEFESILANMNLPGGLSISFDSNNKAAKSDNPMLDGFLDIYRAMVNAKIRYLVDKNGKVLSVQGYQEILDQIPQEVRPFVANEFSEPNMGREIEQLLKILPEKPVKEGDKWSRVEDFNIGNGQTLTYDKEYTYKGTVEKDGKQLDQIEGIAKSVRYEQLNIAEGPVKVKSSELSVDSWKETVLFDRELGDIVSREMQNVLKGKFEMSINEMDFPASVEIKMESKSQRE